MTAHKEREILQWATDRNIIGPNGKATKYSQHEKTCEEFGELTAGLHANDIDEIKDAIGDLYVCLVIQAHMNGLTMAECIDAAYDVIKTRTGRMVDGIFVKDKS